MTRALKPFGDEPSLGVNADMQRLNELCCHSGEPSIVVLNQTGSAVD